MLKELEQVSKIVDIFLVSHVVPGPGVMKLNISFGTRPNFRRNSSALCADIAFLATTVLLFLQLSLRFSRSEKVSSKLCRKS